MVAQQAPVQRAETTSQHELRSGPVGQPFHALAGYQATPLAAAEALAGTPFFGGLSSVELARLVPELEELRYEAGEAVFSQGDRPDGLYLIRLGEARVFMREPGRDETLLATLRPPEYFGEMALVSASARSATVRAATPLNVWRLSTERFRELVAAQPSLPLEIASSLSRRLAATGRALALNRGPESPSLPDVPQTTLEQEREPRMSREAGGLGRAINAYLASTHQVHTTGSLAGAHASAESPRVNSAAETTEQTPRQAAPRPQEAVAAARATFSWAWVRELPLARGALAAAAGALLLAAWLAPPPSGMSEAALRAVLLLVAALAASLFRLMPDFLAFMLMLGLWVVTGVVPARVAASGFSSPTWFLMLATMMLGVGLARSGLPYRAALGMVDRLPARYGLLASCLAGLGVLLSPGMPYAAGRVSLAGPIAQDIADSLRYPARSGGSAGLGLATLLGFGLMGSLFLTGNPMALVLYGLLPPASRAEVTFVNWFLAALPLHLVIFGGMLAVILWRYRPDKERVSERTLQVQRAVLGPMSGGEWLALSVLLVLLAGFTTQPIHGIDPAWLGMFGVAAMIGGRLLDAEAVRRGVNWTLLLYFGVVLGIGEVFRAVELDAWLAGALVPLLETPSIQPGHLIIGIGLLAIATSLVLGMVPAILLLVLAMLPISAQLGMSPAVAGLTVIVAGSQWLYPQQNIVYLSLYQASGERAFSHAQARPAAFAFAALTLLGLAVSVPYWQSLGLLGAR